MTNKRLKFSKKNCYFLNKYLNNKESHDLLRNKLSAIKFWKHRLKAKENIMTNKTSKQIKLSIWSSRILFPEKISKFCLTL